MSTKYHLHVLICATRKGDATKCLNHLLMHAWLWWRRNKVLKTQWNNSCNHVLVKRCNKVLKIKYSKWVQSCAWWKKVLPRAWKKKHHHYMRESNVWCKRQWYKMLETMYCVQPSALCKKGATGCSKPKKLNKHKCVIQMLDENDATKCSKPYITSNVCNQVCYEKKSATRCSKPNTLNIYKSVNFNAWWKWQCNKVLKPYVKELKNDIIW